jgi:hypothetical protein
LKWIGIALLIAAATLITAGLIVAHRAASVIKTRIIETLHASFHGRVELGNVDVAAMHGFEVTGDDLRIYPPDNLVAAGVTQPLIAVKRFDFHAPFLGLFVSPMHVGAVEIEGLAIDVPPGGMRSQAMPPPAKKPHDKIAILVDEIVCNNSSLIVENANPDKGPKDFALRHIELHNVGPKDPWRYQATLINAIPRGEIQASGNFGPWQIDSPGDTPVTGHYTFQHADLNTINGLGGILSSTGDFQGQLNRITIDGTTETPDFSLDSANHPTPLRTRFHAIVDGITGDTYLQPVQATLRNSSFTASGKVVNIHGKGHMIDLDVDIPAGRLQDFLGLAVKTEPPVLTSVIGAKAKLHIRPGKERVVQKLSIQGSFTLRSIRFTNPEVQDKVDMLSLRARGEPEKAKPGAEDVKSHMAGNFSLQQGSIDFPRLAYTLPGAQVNLAGVYSLNGEVFDFTGHVLTDVPLSKMVESRWASLALRMVSPLFRRKGGGADIPVKISGTRSAPKFGLDMLGRHAHDGRGL